MCIISADFWGIQNSESGRGIRATLRGGGGTATAYHLLAELLQQRPDTHVSFLGATKDIEACKSARKVRNAALLAYCSSGACCAFPGNVMKASWVRRCTVPAAWTSTAWRTTTLSSQGWWRRTHTRPSRCIYQAHLRLLVDQALPMYSRVITCMCGMQHGIVAWVRENADLCTLIHGHEWGGALVDLFTVSHFRRLPPGVRTVVSPHGGHMWSLQWKPQRALSVEPLRIDHQVRGRRAALRDGTHTRHQCMRMHAREPLNCRRRMPEHIDTTGNGLQLISAGHTSWHALHDGHIS